MAHIGFDHIAHDLVPLAVSSSSVPEGPSHQIHLPKTIISDAKI